MNIIEMAREAGFDVDEGLFPFEASEDKYIGTEIVLERFAAIIAAHEREECAKTLEEYDPKDSAVSGRGIMAMVIRGRTNENF